MKSEINSNQLKQVVLEKYDHIGQSSPSNSANKPGCCSPSSCCDTIDYEVFAEDYSPLEGYQSEADLGLGCGLPTEFAHIQPGHTVVDLGSGAGNDCFVARQLIGETGNVIGIDFSPAMIKRAQENAQKLNFTNVHFYQGDIEQIPLDDETADVVVSNCVMNLVPDKNRAFSETFRILKPGGHFSISDIVTVGDLPPKIQKDAELYAGCVSGAVDLEEYLSIVKKAGFKNLKVQKQKEINLPDDILKSVLNEQETSDFRKSKTGIYSITLFAKK